MPYDRDAIIERLRKEALERCRKRIEDSAARKQKGVNGRTYAPQDYGLMAAYRKAHGL
jgi:hypothetical protein